MKAATGEYIVFLDADDTLPHTAVQALTEAAAVSNTDLTIGRISKNELLPTDTLSGLDYLTKILEGNSIGYSACRILYKHTFIQGITFPEGYVAHEDGFFTFCCALRCPRVITISDIVYIYNAVENSASHSAFSIKKYHDIVDLLNQKKVSIENLYPHLLPLFYHYKTKTMMVLLQNLSLTKGFAFRKQEKDALLHFSESKRFYRSDLPRSNKALFIILSLHLYYPYKVYRRIKSYCQ